MLYQSFDLYQRSLQAWNPFFELGTDFISHSTKLLPNNPALSALKTLFESGRDATKIYDKPDFDITSVTIDGKEQSIEQVIVERKPFCNLLRFRHTDGVERPRMLLIAALSGHHATLCKGTVKALLPDHDLYLTDWQDARNVALDQGNFGVDDYVSYLIEFIETLGANSHVVAICQPTVQALMATAIMSEQQNPATPNSLTLIAGPLDVRINPNDLDNFATKYPSQWYEQNLITEVPIGYAGVGRRVYPGFLQLGSFMSMNFSQHIAKYQKFFEDVAVGNEEAVEGHRRFYDEYLSVLDLTAEFYLETIERVFREHHLGRGIAIWRGETVNLGAISKTALLTVEGENDDICSVGQTEAAHAMCPNIPKSKRKSFVQPKVGHYGVFNGSKFRQEVAPLITDFIRAAD